MSASGLWFGRTEVLNEMGHLLERIIFQPFLLKPTCLNAVGKRKQETSYIYSLITDVWLLFPQNLNRDRLESNGFINHIVFGVERKRQARHQKHSKDSFW